MTNHPLRRRRPQAALAAIDGFLGRCKADTDTPDDRQSPTRNCSPTATASANCWRKSSGRKKQFDIVDTPRVKDEGEYAPLYVEDDGDISELRRPREPSSRGQEPDADRSPFDDEGYGGCTPCRVSLLADIGSRYTTACKAAQPF